MSKSIWLIFCFLLSGIITGYTQNLTDVDTTLFRPDSTRLLYTKFGNLNLSGYIQAQYQVAQSEGVKNFSGGDFSEFSDSRFMLRRARFKIDYLYAGKKMPVVYFALQVDATERGVVVRDMYGQLIDSRWKRFSLFMGLFAKPFGFETNLSSGVRESPERGRMNQILFPRERDMGVMLNFHSFLTHDEWYDKLNISIGLFNGPGLFTTAEQDSYKDLTGRFQLLPVPLSKDLTVSASVSANYGAVRSNNATLIQFGTDKDEFTVSNDPGNIGRRIKRNYYGADIQLKKKHKWGATELRFEYIKGWQPGNEGSTFTAISNSNEIITLRPFEGIYCIFLQNIVNDKHQLLVKYDFYDPNTSVSGSYEPGNFSNTEMRFDTWGFGYVHYLNKHCKLVLYYDWIRNEELTVAESDIKDNILTARIHFSF